jgi:hypothetical protein
MKELEDHQTIHGRGTAPSPSPAAGSSMIESTKRVMEQDRVLPGFAWHDDYALGHQTMDETHQEFVARVQALLTTDDDDLENALEAFAEHAHRHFGDEDASMREQPTVQRAAISTSMLPCSDRSTMYGQCWLMDGPRSSALLPERWWTGFRSMCA